MSAFCLCLLTMKISIHSEKTFVFNFQSRLGGFGHLEVQKTFIILFCCCWCCLFRFVIFKDQVAGGCVTEKQDRIDPSLQPYRSGSEPSLSRQRRQKKRGQTEHSGEKRQVSRDLFGISRCAAAWEIDCRKLHFCIELLTVAKKVHTDGRSIWRRVEMARCYILVFKCQWVRSRIRMLSPPAKMNSSLWELKEQADKGKSLITPMSYWWTVSPSTSA